WVCRPVPCACPPCECSEVVTIRSPDCSQRTGTVRQPGSLVGAEHLGADDVVVQTQLTIELLDRVRLRLELDDGVDALGLLVDLVGEAALAPDVDLVDRTALLPDHVEERVQRRRHGALVETGIEDDHYFVLTHGTSSPPVDYRYRPRCLRGRRVVASATP